MHFAVLIVPKTQFTVYNICIITVEYLVFFSRSILLKHIYGLKIFSLFIFKYIAFFFLQKKKINTEISFIKHIFGNTNFLIIAIDDIYN